MSTISRDTIRDFVSALGHDPREVGRVVIESRRVIVTKARCIDGKPIVTEGDLDLYEVEHTIPGDDTGAKA